LTAPAAIATVTEFYRNRRSLLDLGVGKWRSLPCWAIVDTVHRSEPLAIQWEPVMKCHNCSNQAMFIRSVGPKDIHLPLCLDCNIKFVQMITLQNDMLERQFNYLAESMDRTIGLPGLTPRFPLRQAVTMEGVTLNNVKIDRCAPLYFYPKRGNTCLKIGKILKRLHEECRSSSRPWQE
jgi:hypothetical protein